MDQPSKNQLQWINESIAELESWLKVTHDPTLRQQVEDMLAAYAAVKTTLLTNSEV